MAHLQIAFQCLSMELAREVVTVILWVVLAVAAVSTLGRLGLLLIGKRMLDHGHTASDVTRLIRATRLSGHD